MRNRRVLFLLPYPLRNAPSQRFRVELFLPFLQENLITYKIQSFLDEKTWEILYQQGGALQKAWGVVKGFLRRVKAVFFDVFFYDYIFIHREASPVGPPVFEFIIAKLWRKKIIYDFDDAIWIPNTSAENKLVAWFKAFWKVKHICSWSHKVVGGNNYLCAYARKYNKRVVLIPTCVDTEKGHNRVKDQHTRKVVIGWTGSHSTMPFLAPVVGVLEELVTEYGAEVVIISNKAPEFSFPGLRFVPWQEATEGEDLLQLNIGIMPLEMDPWCEGKCGFKLIQYMALGIPAVASPVGVNQNIIEQGRNGFLCTGEQDWKRALSTLISSAAAREAMGKAGREKILRMYSIQAYAGTFIDLFS